jgi:hypothetical protein
MPGPDPRERGQFVSKIVDKSPAAAVKTRTLPTVPFATATLVACMGHDRTVGS